MKSKYLCEIKPASGNMDNLKTVMAIKMVRDITGCTLLKAKSVVRGLDQRRGIRKAIMTTDQIKKLCLYDIGTPIPTIIEHPIQYKEVNHSHINSTREEIKKTGYVIKILDSV